MMQDKGYGMLSPEQLQDIIKYGRTVTERQLAQELFAIHYGLREETIANSKDESQNSLGTKSMSSQDKQVIDGLGVIAATAGTLLMKWSFWNSGDTSLDDYEEQEFGEKGIS